MNNTTETLRIRCKQTGEVYNASENFTKKYEPIDLSTAEFKYECAANYTPDYQVPNGYFVINKTGGNANHGWFKLFSLDSVEVIA
jgi:hypothetical protein